MMDINTTMDQYEKQLYTLFTSYDSDHNGSLTREALEDLCNTLQLESRGHQLINLLLKENNKSKSVTFTEFRDGLLTVLGNENYNSPTKMLDANDIHSSEESSGREISPKYVYGSKKYGRRSRPSHKNESTEIIKNTSPENDNSSVEVVDIESKSSFTDKTSDSKKKKSNFRIKRSISFSGNGNYEPFEGVSDDICSSKDINLSNVTGMENTDSSNSQHLLNKHLNSPIPSFKSERNNSNGQAITYPAISLEDLLECQNISTVSDVDKSSYSTICETKEQSVSAENIIELWESAGIGRSQQLLHDLNLNNSHVKISELICILDEEIKLMINNVQETFTSHSLITLFQAILCLCQFQTKSLKFTLNHTSAERDKFKSDLLDANQRAVLLAHEVDENHIKMEKTMKNTIKQLEIKHSETIKKLSEEAMSEKEQLSSMICKLENKLSIADSEESKLKSLISHIQDDNVKIEKELNNSQEQILELVEIKRQLSKELKILSNEKHKKEENQLNDKNMMFLENQLKILHKENMLLRDKNDELCAELESFKINRSTEKSKTTWVENYSSTNVVDKICNRTDSPVTIAHVFGINGTKRRGESPSQCQDYIHEECPRISKLRKCTKSNLPECNVENIHSHTDSSSADDEKGQIINEICNNDSCFNFDVNLQDKKAIDLLVYVKYLTPDNTIKIMEMLKANTKTLSFFFTQSDIKPCYLGLYSLLKKILEDIKLLMKENKTIINSCFVKSDTDTLIKNIVNEILNVNLDDHHIFDILTTFDEITDNKLFNCRMKCLSNESSIIDCTKNIDSHVKNLESKIDELSAILEKERQERKDEKSKDLEKYMELESNMEMLKNEYDKCEEYWSSKVNEEREIYDHEQRITDEKFAELLSKLSEYEEQFTSQDTKNDRLSTIEEKYNLEKQFTDLEDEFEEYKNNTEDEIKLKNEEISQLKDQIKLLQLKINENSPKNENCVSNSSQPSINTSESCIIAEQPKLSLCNEIIDKPTCISSPINYLWNQKTIASPITNIRSNVDNARDYHNPAFVKDSLLDHTNDMLENNTNECSISPIQKPTFPKNNVPFAKDIFENRRLLDNKHEMKMLHCSDLEEALQGRRKEVQQLEATRARLDAEVRALSVQKCNPQNQVSSAILKSMALEIHCRQLQSALRQQQSYTETIMQQTIASHRGEVGALRQRLAAADLLVRDLYVENCHLARNLTNSVSQSK